MPLSEDASVNSLANSLNSTLRGAFGTPDSYRPAHAKGHLVRGIFEPTQDAASISKAPHFNRASTPVIARFSNSTGIPKIADTDGNAGPRGMAVRFILDGSGHKHTDIVAHSTALFPTRNGEDFLAMLQAMGDGSIGSFLEDHPAAAAFIQAPKQFPESFATERYFGVNAFKFVSSEGKEVHGRYRVVPKREAHIDPANKSDSYLFEELSQRLSQGPASFKLLVQIAEHGDIVDDATKRWPDERRLVELGSIRLQTYEEDNRSRCDEQRIIFDPIPRVEGVEPSSDPLLELRASLYLVSGRIRRAAPQGA